MRDKLTEKQEIALRKQAEMLGLTVDQLLKIMAIMEIFRTQNNLAKLKRRMIESKTAEELANIDFNQLN